MRRFRGLVLVLACAVAAPVADAQIATDSLTISGFVESSIQHSTADQGGLIVGSLYGRRQDSFTLNAFQLRIDRPIAPDRTMAGFTLRLLYGASATGIHASGLSIGPHADLTQAFVTFHRPTRAGRVQVFMGKLPSLMGLEVIESAANPNLSVGNQFIFLEDLTHVGLETQWDIDAAWSMRAGMANGWDVAVDNNNGKTLMARLTWTPKARTSFAVLGYGGPESSGNSRDLRTGGELLFTVPIGPTTATMQGDIGREEGIDASWWGAGVWWTIPLESAVTLALRGDIVDDENGARTSGVLGYPPLDRHRLASLTMTVNWAVLPKLKVRPEVRIDRSSHGVFDGNRDQVTYAIGSALQY